MPRSVAHTHTVRNVASAADLLAQAGAQPTSGWDFTWLGPRMQTDGVPWDYPETVARAVGAASSVLDMGTGGGEFLSALHRFPRRTVATEGWAPNVRVASERLTPLGVAVVHDEGAVDNVDQFEQPPRGRLAFRNDAFDLVTNRHEAYHPAEVLRVLQPGGRFLTQQADSGGADASAALGLEPPRKALFDRRIAVAQLEAVGFHVRDGASAIETLRFADVGAFAWYLRMIPWTVPDFSIEAHRDALDRLHAGGEPIVVRGLRFWIEAEKDTR
jgi:SAM-dependent methyltransferase